MTAENKQIVFLAGYSAAGKSTLAREMRNNWDYTLIEHQPLVHDIASRKGYERARHWLAEVGVEKFAEESTNEMVTRTKQVFDEREIIKVVFDVAYGVKMLELFQKEFPDIFRLVVSVIADEDTRAINIQKRMGTESKEEAKKELRFRDGFLHEIGVDEVIQQSDIKIINKDRSIGEVASELNELIGQRILKK